MDDAPNPACDLTVYVNAACSKCRSARELLDGEGVEVTYVEYLVTPPSRADLERLLGLLGTSDPREMMRTGEPVYAELGLADASRDELLDAISEHPILLERPIAVRGERAVIARPPERVRELLA